MLRRIVLSVIVGVAVTLGCMLVGALLGAINIEVAETIGNFLTKYSGAFGILAALWYFFTGRTA